MINRPKNQYLSILIQMTLQKLDNKLIIFLNQINILKQHSDSSRTSDSGKTSDNVDPTSKSIDVGCLSRIRCSPEYVFCYLRQIVLLESDDRLESAGREGPRAKETSAEFVRSRLHFFIGDGTAQRIAEEEEEEEEPEDTIRSSSSAGLLFL